MVYILHTYRSKLITPYWALIIHKVWQLKKLKNDVAMTN